ncbi:hypothetical protein HID58_055229, partial [Brassica napus]
GDISKNLCTYVKATCLHILPMSALRVGSMSLKPQCLLFFKKVFDETILTKTEVRFHVGLTSRR